MLALGLATAVIVAILDQLSKMAVLAHFATQAVDADRVTPFFNLVLTLNRGMSFGLFNRGPAAGGALNALLFSLAAVVIVAGLVYWLRRVASPLLAVAIGLIVGGAIGNVADRIRHGAVVDFLDFHIGYWHWPAFNLADSAICLGVAMMLFDGLLLRREAH
ncbi:MAG TPA: signal peptidase II [Stellaceae bacterium]|jgi:signal peptidase II|nr:signal peptidase II [Stellaceae bacterium]